MIIFRLALFALALPAAALAAAPTTAPATAPHTVTAAYPFADLIAPRPDLAGAHGMVPPNADGSPAQPAPEPAADPAADPADGPTRAELVDNIIQLVQSVVDQPSWALKGRSIVAVGDNLIITQTPENQRTVVQLMRALRGWREGTLMIEAVWPSLRADRLAAAVKGGTLDALVAKLDPSTPRAVVRSRNGKPVRIASALPPAPAPATLPAKPAGYFAELTANVIRETAGKPPASATLGVYALFDQLDAPPALAMNLVGGFARLTSSLTVPMDHWALIAGMTPAAGAAAPDGTQVYLLVRVTAPDAEAAPEQ